MIGEYVYLFGNGHADGHAGLRDLVGGKGAGLADMTRLGLPVPPGFTVATTACVHYFKHKEVPAGLLADVRKGLKQLEEWTGRRFGDAENPLLLSVRSGARASMPGMMDTVLNLGLNSDTVRGLSKGGDRFAWDSYRRFVHMYGHVVLGVDDAPFEKAIHAAREREGVKTDAELSAAALKALTFEYQDVVKAVTGNPFPTDPYAQLETAIIAVFHSWNTPRATLYRQMEKIPDEWGTAVNVQVMVFGNMGEDCATGVAFTRDPSTGERKFFGEFLVNAQGEDVVAGIRTPRPLSGTPDSLAAVMPATYEELDTLRLKLETHYHDMQDIEFTMERGKLYMLQTRNGKRTAFAAVKIAVDMVNEGLIDKREAVKRVQPKQIETLLHPQLDLTVKPKVLATGIPGGSGAATGQLAFTAEEAVEMAAAGKTVILLREETSPEDLAGMNAAKGIVTARGGATSHAAVVARGMGRSCVVGCTALHVDEHNGVVTVGDVVLRRGDVVTLGGTEGWLIAGDHPKKQAELADAFGTILEWADEFRKLGIRANADSPTDAKMARKFGAQGIGLCRTEHMFFEETRIRAVREMILSDSVEERRKALAKILPMQENDFLGLFREMRGFPVTIRLLDPPLHEFLPHTREDLAPIAADMGVSVDALATRVSMLHELNPMLGHRGCRLLVTYPEITEMQTEAIISAACKLVKNEGHNIVPEIMIPLVGFKSELEYCRKTVVETADRVIASYGVKLDYLVGTMIELPRAAVTANAIAEHADFFSFGTNDLTQTTLGLSRDDAGRFLPVYLEKRLLPADPFATMDSGVAELVKMGTERGRSVKPKLKVGICGEHGGDPDSITICHGIGLDYVSCSPFRVPVARMAAAHAALKDEAR